MLCSSRSSSAATTSASRTTIASSGGVASAATQCGAPCELFQEGGAHSFRALDDVVEITDLGLHAAEVPFEKSAPALVVGKLDLDGLVDPAGPRRERGLQQIDAVRREHEDHVGVFVEPVHLVEQLEQQWVRAHAGHRSLHRNEIDVFEHEHRRLQAARDGRGLAERRSRLPAEQDRRAPWHPAAQVHHREGLSRAGRTEQQEPPLEVPARVAESFRVGGNSQGVAFDRVEIGLGQDEVVAGQHGQPVELEPERSPLAEGEREDLAAVHVELVGEGPQVREELDGGIAARAHHFDLQTAAHPSVRIPEAHQDDERIVAEVQQPQRPK